MESVCNYMFGNYSNEMFGSQDVTVVNESLSTLTKIIDYLAVSKPEAFFVFDPAAFNNQCHLYALFTAQLVTQAKAHRITVDLIAKATGYDALPERLDHCIRDYGEVVDRRMLYHAFFLSYAFMDTKLLSSLTERSLRDMHMQSAATKPFQLFCRENGRRLKLLRKSYNDLFAAHMKRSLSAVDEPLYRKLSAIAHSNLQLDDSGKISQDKNALYTFPKFAGVAYLIDVLVKERIPLLFKVKVVTDAGNAMFAYSAQNLSALESSVPVVVFEMVATGENISYLQYRELAKKCPSHSRRHVKSSERHAEAVTCLSCNPARIDPKPYVDQFLPILQQPSDLLLALGADFVRQNQPDFQPFFTDRDKFPQLTQLFAHSVPNITRYALSMNHGLNLSVSHCYTDCVSRALRGELVIDNAYATHLEQRGLTS